MSKETLLINNYSGVLSNKAILRHMDNGNIIIDPFNLQNLKTTSYDVTLGEYYFEPLLPQRALHIYNPYSEEEVRRIWGQPKLAPLAKEVAEYGPAPKLLGAKEDDRVILIPPRKIFLCHTHEFIGGRNCVTTMMKARSSWGRNFIEVCRDAGWGDVGYINRWTMEVANTSDEYYIPLIVGRRVAQIIFFEVEPPITEENDYAKNGKYQSVSGIDEVKKNWTPYAMLPMLYKDFEAEGSVLLLS